MRTQPPLAMDIRGKQPSTWDEYDGVHRGSVDSTGSRVRWDELERRPSGQSGAGAYDASPSRHGDLRRRRCVLFSVCDYYPYLCAYPRAGLNHNNE